MTGAFPTFAVCAQAMQQPYDLSGLTAVVTGAGKGIGRGIALCLANAGADVVVAARSGAIKNGPYAACKAAVNSLTQTLALELAPAIRVNAIGPGPIPTENFNASTSFPPDTPLEKLIRVPLGRLGTPEEIGHAVVFMASPGASWITGQCLSVNGGL
ncbi:MAG: SDR family oxidoreductase [Proteobacteria bacterium]|nr:SDR family oxidoreductase [Pseudomonadota bacterium]